MSSEKFTREQKDSIYKSFEDDRELLEGYPYLRLPDREAFFQEGDPTRKPSFLKRLYHTFF